MLLHCLYSKLMSSLTLLSSCKNSDQVSDGWVRAVVRLYIRGMSTNGMAPTSNVSVYSHLFSCVDSLVSHTYFFRLKPKKSVLQSALNMFAYEREAFMPHLAPFSWLHCKCSASICPHGGSAGQFLHVALQCTADQWNWSSMPAPQGFGSVCQYRAHQTDPPFWRCIAAYHRMNTIPLLRTQLKPKPAAWVCIGVHACECVYV